MGARRGSRLLPRRTSLESRWRLSTAQDQAGCVVVTSWADRSISVVIPTKNAGAEFSQTLAEFRPSILRGNDDGDRSIRPRGHDDAPGLVLGRAESPAGLQRGSAGK